MNTALIKLEIKMSMLPCCNHSPAVGGPGKANLDLYYINKILFKIHCLHVAQVWSTFVTFKETVTKNNAQVMLK